MMQQLLKPWAAAGALALALATATAAEPAGLAFPGKNPGTAVATDTATLFTLSGHAVSASWKITDWHLRPASLTDELTGRELPPPEEAFRLEFRDGRVLKASEMRILDRPVTTVLTANPAASRTAERVPGVQVAVTLLSKDGTLKVDWKAMLRDGSNYIRQEIVVSPLKGDADIAKVVLVDHKLIGADIVGQVPGSPVIAGNVFTGFEHPMSVSSVKMGIGGDTRIAPEPVDKGAAECEDDPLPGDVKKLKEGLGAHHAQCWLERALPLKEGKTFTCSSVLGVTPEGQLRRGFLYYVERERAHAYRTFLHYNSWYDIGYFTPFDEKDCLGVVNAFAAELGEKRGVTMDSFLFDDGWDDTSKGGEWVFHKGFPNGFMPLREAAAKVGAGPGVWLSPWGGYGKPREQRVQSGKAAGYEASGSGYNTLFALSGPKYYANFHRACMEMVTKYGINQFKLDGTGNINSVVPGSQFGSDFEAAIALIQDLRAVKPDLYVNLTTGTWPSPFWLSICDSIWRGGEDHSFVGVGSARQRWITYRDADTYQRVVRGGPLYPVTSLMLHGILYAKKANKLETDYENDFPSEVRSYFGGGTQLQEMYVSHELMTDKNWDTLAEGAKWSRANAATLVDTHWIGGDPEKLLVYGWASWSPEKGILTLRNSSDKEKSLTVDLAKFFELPAGAAASYRIVTPFKQRALKEFSGVVEAGKPAKVTLKGFEVLVFEAVPVK